MSTPVSTSSGVIAAEAAARGATQAFSGDSAPGRNQESRTADDFNWEDMRPGKRQKGNQHQQGGDWNDGTSQGSGGGGRPRGRGRDGRGRGGDGRGGGRGRDGRGGGRGRDTQQGQQSNNRTGDGSRTANEDAQALNTYSGSISNLRSYNKTASGTEKCYKWNNGKPYDGDCNRAHVCMFCGQPHTMKWHKQQMPSSGGSGKRI